MTLCPTSKRAIQRSQDMRNNCGTDATWTLNETTIHAEMFIITQFKIITNKNNYNFFFIG